MSPLPRAPATPAKCSLARRACSASTRVTVWSLRTCGADHETHEGRGVGGVLHRRAVRADSFRDGHPADRGALRRQEHAESRRFHGRAGSGDGERQRYRVSHASCQRARAALREHHESDHQPQGRAGGHTGAGEGRARRDQSVAYAHRVPEPDARLVPGFRAAPEWRIANPER